MYNCIVPTPLSLFTYIYIYIYCMQYAFYLSRKKFTLCSIELKNLSILFEKKYLLIFRYMFGHIVTLIYIVNYLIEEH